MLGLRRYQRTQIDIWQGDITSFYVDAIVNAANTDLAGGGGVDGAIHAAGGPSIGEECRRIGKCDTGSCVITTAGRLPAKHLIHAVGPMWTGGGDDEGRLLSLCYENVLKTAVSLGVRHISIPAISTGAYNFPATSAAEIAFSVTRRFLDNNPSTALKRITFVARDGDSYRILQEQLFARFPDEIDEFGE